MLGFLLSIMCIALFYGILACVIDRPMCGNLAVSICVIGPVIYVQAQPQTLVDPFWAYFIFEH